MSDLVPIKVKIGLKANGHAKYPDWRKLQIVKDNPDYIPGRTGGGCSWVYDKKYGHAENGPDSPVGMQWGLLFVEETFALQAVAEFPDEVTIISELEAEDFWNNRSRAHLPEFKHDTEELQGLQAELGLKKEVGQDITEVKQRIVKALDPDDSSPGVRRTPGKTLAQAKIDLGISLKKGAMGGIIIS